VTINIESHVVEYEPFVGLLIWLISVRVDFFSGFGRCRN